MTIDIFFQILIHTEDQDLPRKCIIDIIELHLNAYVIVSAVVSRI